MTHVDLVQLAGSRGRLSEQPTVDPVTADATSGFALLPAYVTSTWVCRKQLAPVRHWFWLLLGPVGFLLAAQTGYLQSFDHQLNAVCTIIAAYNFAAASELARMKGERLTSRVPAVALLVIVGLSYLSWLALNLAMPIREAQWVMVSFWFPATILLTVLLRTALAFTVLSMAKERRELEQRVEALTDALTGLANRRALFEAADAVSQDRDLRRDAISVLILQAQGRRGWSENVTRAISE